jgi:Na+/H+-dicarboxylate symporter
MSSFFNFFATNSSGIFTFLASLVVIVLLTQWLAWIFSWGRYKEREKKDTPRLPGVAGANQSTIYYVATNFFERIIVDFRNLLALLVILIFSLALGFAIFKAGDTVDGLSQALQAVTSALTGLVGSIIGYYFGESTARSAQQSGVREIGSTTATQVDTTGGNESQGADIELTPTPRAFSEATNQDEA